MDRVDLRGEWQRGVDDLLGPDADQMVARREDLLADQHRRAADEAGEPAPDLRVGDLVVAGDRDRIEPLPLRLEHESDRRQRAVAPGRTMEMEVGGEQATLAERDRRPRLRPIGDRPDRDADEKCDEARAHPHREIHEWIWAWICGTVSFQTAM